MSATFSTVARHLAAHLTAAENRCRAFEAEARGMKQALANQHGSAVSLWWWTEYLIVPQRRKRTLSYEEAGQRLVEYNEERKRLRKILESRIKRQEQRKARRRIAHYVKKELKRRQGATLSEREYLSLKDALSTLVDGRIRHNYDRHKADRTPNSAEIRWQKMALRTGESQDNLRKLLKQAGRKHEGEFDALDTRLEELQESLKSARNALMLDVRAVRVSGWSEEVQEFRLSRAAGSASELRLRPPCGDSLDECTCGQSYPAPVEKGSLSAAIRDAAAKASMQRSSTVPVGVVDRRGAVRSRRMGEAEAALHVHKRRRVVEDDDEEGQDQGTGAGREKAERRFRGASYNGAGDDCSSLDEIKRQMGKNPRDLERSKLALEEEMRMGAEASFSWEGSGLRGSCEGGRGNGGAVSGSASIKAIGADSREGGSGETSAEEGRGARGIARDKKGEHNAWEGGHGGAAELSEPSGSDWRDDLLGLPPHARAEVYEERGLFQEALRWHREDLVAARAQVRDGEDEDERGAGLDFARALRNTGRCLGKLGMRGFAQAKALLTEARELVGPNGPSPSTTDEQDVVLELGNLWYNRYLLCDSEGMRFFATEALEEALRCYRESRELCVDLVADSDDAELECDATAGADLTPRLSAAVATPAGALVRAEFNLGMALVEGKRYDDAVSHLQAVEEGCRELVRMAGWKAGVSGEDPGTGDVEAANGTPWRVLFLREDVSGLGSLYASSLVMLGECSASPSSGIPARGGPGRNAPLQPLGLAVSATSPNLKNAAHIFEKAVDVFLTLGGGNPAEAMNPLERLVGVLRLQGGERDLLRAEALCDRVLGKLEAMRKSSSGEGTNRRGDAGSGSDEGDGDGELSAEVSQVRREIEVLRLRRGRRNGIARTLPENHRTVAAERQRLGGSEDGAASLRDPSVDAKRGETGSPRRADDELEQEAGRDEHFREPAGVQRRFHYRGRGGSFSGHPREGVDRSGRLATAPVLQSSSRVIRNGRAVSHGIEGRDVTGSKDTRLAAGTGKQAERGPTGGDSGSNAGGKSTSRRTGSFAMLRRAMVRMTNVSVSAAAAVSEGGAGRRPASGAEEAGAFQAYRETCAFLRVKPNPLALDRMFSINCHSVGTNEGTDASETQTSRRGHPEGQSVLDLRSCCLSDRQLQVLLFAVLHRERRPVLGIRGTNEPTASVGNRQSSPRPDGNSLRVKIILLSGNPGIGVGGLRALWGLSGDTSGSKNSSEASLFSSLQRLDISGCGLVASDLIGLAPPFPGSITDENGFGALRSTVDGMDDFGSDHRGSTSGINAGALRALVLRDNPLTRLPGAKSTDAGNAVEVGWQGLRALRDLIARAPSLEILDASGCSQLPDGPASRLYSKALSDSLAAALAAGLESRLANALSGDTETRKTAVPPTDRVDEEQFAQVHTLRLGGNHFEVTSWVKVLRAISVHPPRELDLSWASSSFVATATASSTSGSAPPDAALPTATATEAPTPVGGFPMTQYGVEPPGHERVGGDSPLGELLPALILPPDGPGIEVLNLTGSRGLLACSDASATFRSEVEEDLSQTLSQLTPVSEERAEAPTAAVSVMFRDSLMSPLCRVTHLFLSGMEGVASGERVKRVAVLSSSAETLPRDGSCLPLGPEYVRGFCEASSACASLRVLDLAGSDLSGPRGVSAAAAAVACLIKRNASGVFFEESFDGIVSGDEREGSSDEKTGGISGTSTLSRLSLRACRLGAAGLSAILAELVEAVAGTRQGRWPNGSRCPANLGRTGRGYEAEMRENVRRIRRFLSSLPHALDLSENRPEPGPTSVSSPSGSSAATTRRADEVHAGTEQSDLEGITAPLRALQGGVPLRSALRLRGDPAGANRSRSSLRPVLDLSGNRLGEAASRALTDESSAGESSENYLVIVL